MEEQKKRLRKEAAEKIKALSPEYTKEADAAICRGVLSLPEYKEAKTIFCFVSMAAEVNTHPILSDALASGKRLCVPRCISKGVMELRQIKGHDDLKAGAYGILEPAESCPVVSAAEIDFGIIPCVTCNKKGERLGHGGGYYDRFLEGATFPATLICREQVLEEDIPMMEHDVRIPIVVTEDGVFLTQ